MKLDQLKAGDTVWCRLVGKAAAEYESTPGRLVQEWIVREVTEHILIACLDGFQNDEEMQISFERKQQYRQSTKYYPNYILFTTEEKAWNYLPEETDTVFIEKKWFQRIYIKECYTVKRNNQKQKRSVSNA